MSDVATTRSAAAAARALTLDDFPVHRPVTTRWSDNDMYGHLNNAVYYELFDSAINGWQAEHVTTDPLSDPTQGVVAESGCSFFAEVGFPSSLVVGLRVTRIGRTSITYELGLFIDPADPSQTSADESGIKALGHWVHVEIDAVTRRPTPIPDHLRTLLESAVQPPPGMALTPPTPEADAS
jgi:acyl-CoA thioester hydrolase